MKLKGKVAIVTGSGKGLGRAMVLDMAAEGAGVVVTDMNYDSCLAVKDEVEKMGGRAIAVKCNVTDRGEVAALVAETVRAFGRVDILVNNAGITRDASFLKMTDEQWDAVLTTDLKSIFICSQEVCKSFKDGGKIVNISSIAGVTGNFGQTNYSAAKAGIIGMTKTLSKELGRKNINVNAVAPGYINTEMTRTIPDHVKQGMIAQIPLNRPGEPEEVARVVTFLASEEASYITGQTIQINGGSAN